MVIVELTNQQTENPGAEDSQPFAADQAGDRLAFFWPERR
jgi:hypothetical protein